jgi:thiamine pyrophosphokinase
MQDIYEEHLQEIENIDEEIEEDFDELDKEWEKTVKKNKQKKEKNKGYIRNCFEVFSNNGWRRLCCRSASGTRPTTGGACSW